MKTHEIKLTWTDRDGNAACIGNDETVTIEAGSAEDACREAIAAAQHHHHDDYTSGRYRIAAECDGASVTE